MTTLFLDVETFSAVPITAGVYKYAEGSELLLLAWALDDTPASVWDAIDGELMPNDLADALEDPSVVLAAHNAMFDRTILNYHGFDTELTRWRCTQIQALAHSLPSSLAQLCDVLKVDAAHMKMKEGKDLINLFCKPRKKGRATVETHPAQWATFAEYARRDIDAMRAVSKKMPKWNMTKAEVALWHLDQTINDRGVAVDLELARAAVAAVGVEQKRLAARADTLTNGAVQAATQRDALKNHMEQQHGLQLENMRKATIQEALAAGDLPDDLRELLEVRLSASSSSTAKYQAFLNCACTDDRVHGMLQFCGALRTGRWSGRFVQLQNLPRPKLKAGQIDKGIAALKAGVADLVVDDVMELLSSSIRGCIVAPPERKLVVADLAAIEGRVLAWLAGEEWALAAYRDFDTVRLRDGSWMSGPDLTAARLARLPVHLALDAKGEPIRKGHDFYKLTYAQAFRVPVEEVTKDQRQIGKVLVLSMGYGGGVGGFVTFANAYGMDLEAMSADVTPTLPKAIFDEAVRMLDWCRETSRPIPEVSDRVFIVCDSLKRLWRQANPQTVAFWRELEDACRAAIQGKDSFRVRRLVVDTKGAYLRIRLPSGRYLCYPAPRVSEDGELSFYGKNQFNNKWGRVTTHGPKTVENATQAVARDVMASGMQPLEDAGYALVLSVHDELLAETPDTEEFNADHMSAIMSVPPKWAPDLPLAAEGFETTRYRK